jgi:hypothetical protein
MDFLAVPPLPNRLRSASSYPAYLAPLVTCWGLNSRCGSQGYRWGVQAGRSTSGLDLW